MKQRISKRELQVLELIGDELTISEIAKNLYISHHTVISHRKNLLTKLGARNTAGLIVRAFNRGILIPSYSG